MSECPKMVGELIQCGAKIEYDVVKLMLALNLECSQQLLDHEKQLLSFGIVPFILLSTVIIFLFLLL